MARRRLLDTGVLIGLERGRIPSTCFADTDDLCVSIITIAEYMTGLTLAGSLNRPRARGFLDAMSDWALVLPYDEEILDTHVQLLAWTHQQGRLRGQHDLIIAATAIATGRTLLTTDHKAHFEELPGLEVEFVG